MDAPRIQRKPVSRPGDPAPASFAPRRTQSSYALRADTDAAPTPFGMLGMQHRAGSSTSLAPPPYTHYAAAVDEPPPPLPLRPRPSVGQFGQFGPGIASASAETPKTAPAADAADAGAPPPKEQPSFWKTALDETRFFAGGLIQKPYESTKHYTLLRHSAGLVIYRGPATSVVVTLFSSPDRPVLSASSASPARSVWLQRRGYSGDAGLRLKTLVGASSSWLDVTPARPAAAADLPAADERGYQRDIQRLLKKTVRGSKHYDKSVAGRVPRETLVVRIPAACADGYFRLVVCATSPTSTDDDDSARHKKKVLCGSPVFRVASASTDASVLRGASLATLPVEAGVKIASLLGTRYVAGAAAPIVSTVQDQVSKYQPGAASTMAAQTAYDSSTLPARVAAAGDSYSDARATAYEALGPSDWPYPYAPEDDVPPEVVGDDRGPSPPFPIQFQGRVVRGSGRSTAQLGVPTANLAGVSDDIRLRLRTGVFFGWAAVAPSKKSVEAGAAGAAGSNWIEALVTVAPPHTPAKTAVVHPNEVAVHLLCDLGGASLLDTKLSMLLMAFLSPSTDAAASDASPPLVVASLSRPAWGAQATLARIDAQRSARSLADKVSDTYVDTRGRVQKQVDRIPFHLAGVRTAAGEMRDQLFGNGGFYIVR